MKKLLLAGLLLSGLSGCSKGGGNNPAPTAPTLTGNVWVWTSETTVATNKTTGAVTSQSKTVVPNTIKVTYTTNGTYTFVADKSVTSTGADITTSGTYTYSGGTVAHTTGGKTTTARVDGLTANNLTMVGTDENSTMRYVTTDTYAR